MMPIRSGCSCADFHRNMRCSPSRFQRGFSLITAIFLLVVVVSLGTLMMTFWSAQQQSSALDVLGARAQQASKAGIEWGAYQVTRSAACAPQTQVDLSGTALSPYTLIVYCSATTHTESGVAIQAYTISSVATGINGASPGSADYVERVTRAAIWQ